MTPASQILDYVIVASGLSAADVSRLSGVPRSTISRCRRGENEPDYATMAKVLDALGFDWVPVDVRFTARTTPPKKKRR
jgi:transcriptional regulator with XRE-family HTH domain